MGHYFDMIATDRYGYGHEPSRVTVPAATRKAAIAEARDRYGKATGLNSTDIRVRVLAVADERGRNIR